MNDTLNELHGEIKAIYEWYAKEAPGVTPQEVGRLGDLWQTVDYLEAQADG